MKKLLKIIAWLMLITLIVFFVFGTIATYKASEEWAEHKPVPP